MLLSAVAGFPAAEDTSAGTLSATLADRESRWSCLLVGEPIKRTQIVSTTWQPGRRSTPLVTRFQLGVAVVELFPAKQLGGKRRAHGKRESEGRYITPVARPRIAVPDASEQ